MDSGVGSYSDHDSDKPHVLAMNLVVPIHPWHNGEMLKDSIFAEAPGQNQDDNIRVGMLSMKIQETTSIVILVYKLYGWFTIRLQRYEMYKMNIYLYIGTLKKYMYVHYISC